MFKQTEIVKIKRSMFQSIYAHITNLFSCTESVSSITTPIVSNTDQTKTNDHAMPATNYEYTEQCLQEYFPAEIAQILYTLKYPLCVQDSDNNESYVTLQLQKINDDDATSKTSKEPVVFGILELCETNNAKAEPYFVAVYKNCKFSNYLTFPETPVETLHAFTGYNSEETKEKEQRVASFIKLLVTNPTSISFANIKSYIHNEKEKQLVEKVNTIFQQAKKNNENSIVFKCQDPTKLSDEDLRREIEESDKLVMEYAAKGHYVSANIENNRMIVLVEEQIKRNQEK